jgi:hypothetical protein
MTSELIKSLSKYSSKNKVYTEASEKCVCYYCLNYFAPNEIKEWVDGGETALCPICKIDSVLGDSVVSLDDEELKEANKYWFW